MAMPTPTIGDKYVFKATANAATGTVAITGSPTYTVYDAYGIATALTGGAEIADTTPAASVNVGHDLDTATLTAGFYTLMLRYDVLGSDGITRHYDTPRPFRLLPVPNPSLAVASLTASDYWGMIADELNQGDNERLWKLLPCMWLLNAGRGGSELQYLWTKRQAIDALMGGVWELVDTGTGAVTGAVLLSQQMKNLAMIRVNVETQIKRLAGNLRVSVPSTSLTEPFIGTPTGEFG